jgi:hypothetical protein
MFSIDAEGTIHLSPRALEEGAFYVKDKTGESLNAVVFPDFAEKVLDMDEDEIFAEIQGVPVYEDDADLFAERAADGYVELNCTL